jgi:dCMP deaminase
MSDDRLPEVGDIWKEKHGNNRVLVINRIETDYVTFKDDFDSVTLSVKQFLDIFMYLEVARPRPSQYYMNIANAVSKRGTCTRAQVGAVAVKDTRILATGYNGAPRKLEHCRHYLYDKPEDDPDLAIIAGRYSCNKAIHAEANLIAFAAGNQGISLKNCTVYTTAYPCLSCFKQMISARVGKVVYLKGYFNDPNVSKLAEKSITLHSLEEALTLEKWEL